MDALMVGEAARDLGAGRLTMDTVIDMGSGIMLNKVLGDKVEKGEEILSIYTDKDNYDEILNLLEKNIIIGKEQKDHPLIYEEID